MKNIINNKSNALKPGTTQHKTVIRIAPIIKVSHTFI